MRSPIQFRFGLRSLLTFCLGIAFCVANFAPRHHQALEIDGATLKRIEHSWLPLDPADPVGPETFTDVTTKGWPTTAYLSHRNPFSHVTAQLSGNRLETHESYVDGRGVAVNTFVAVMALIACYVIPLVIASARRGRAISEKTSSGM